MRKISVLLAVLALLALTLTACSQPAAPGPTQPSDAGTAAPASGTNSPGAGAAGGTQLSGATQPEVIVLLAAKDLPSRGTEPYVRISAATASALGMPEAYTTGSQNKVVRLQVGDKSFNATWELYSAEGDTRPVMRLSAAGLKATGLKADQVYAASYDPEAKMVTLVPLAAS